MAEAGELKGGPELRTTYCSIGSRIRPVQYTEVDGNAVVEGCIILGTVQEAEQALVDVRGDPGLLRADSTVLGVGIVGRKYRWPGGVMPYELDGLSNPQRVLDAIEHWQTNTAIRFVKRDPANPAHNDYVAFVNGSGCSSQVGRRGGRQTIILGPACSVGNAIHEIGHALGLWHEQSRADRDLHVTIKWDRIEDGMEHNFSQHIHDGEDIGPYDFGSIMHYPQTAFSKDGQPTIEIVDNKYAGQVGQRQGLSDGDRQTIAKMYAGT